MDTFKNSHLGGAELLPASEEREILEALHQCKTPVKRGFGSELRNEIEDGLFRQGWTGRVQIAHGSKITIAAQKNMVGLGIQVTGNMSRMYADLIKLQQMYLSNIIDIGVLVLPTAMAARELGDNLANSDRLISELHIFRKVIYLPIAVISFQ